jgi:hypothetical protein
MNAEAKDKTASRDFSISFPVHFECEIYATEVGESFTLVLRLNEAKTTKVSAAFGFAMGTHSTFTIPSSVFPNEDARAAWIDRTVEVFKRTLVEVMTDEARLRFNDIGNFNLTRMGLDPEPVTERFVIDTHLKETEARVRRFLGKGLRSQWSKTELEQAIRGAMAILKKHERNYAGVVKALKKTHPHKAPPSVPALKQLVIRKELDWMKLKSNI